ncbi:hypothetical protein, partial [Pseudomonas sp. 2995-3]|uniref:hypothetical protein n=1 Tax=Pseudomonas sp. 2995-3 TaxID=1712680 RepID=UPI001C48C4BD
NYSQGVLYLTPVVTYLGEDPLTIHYGSSVAWVDKVVQEDEIIYEHDEPTSVITHQSTLEEEDERTGQTIRIEVDPGFYDVT